MTEEHKGVMEVHAIIATELTVAYGRWQLFCQLFGTSIGRVDLLNRSAPFFFAELQAVWLDSAVLSICRLGADKEEHKRRGKENIAFASIEQLHSRLSEPNKQQHSDAKSSVTKSCQVFQTRRNAVVAHAGLTALSESEFQSSYGFSRAHVNTALASIADYLNLIETHFNDGNTTNYAHTILPLGECGDALIYNLVRAQEFKKQELQDLELTQQVNCEFEKLDQNE